MSEHRPEGTGTPDLIASYAAFWWAQESGETEAWDELDADEREAIIENSYAEHVADWFAQRMADLDRYVGKVPDYHAELSNEATGASEQEKVDG